jgi:hypothetical protein
VNDDVALESVGPWLTMTDVLNLLGGYTKLLKDVMEHPSETSVA